MERKFEILKKRDGKETSVSTEHMDTLVDTDVTASNQQIADSVSIKRVSVNHGSNERSIELVKKTFKNPEKSADALSNYTIAKKAGLKVPPTYRIDESDQSIYMTNLNKGDHISLSANNEVPPEARGISIESIPEGFDSFLDQYFSQAIIATKNGLNLYYDMPMFTFKKNTEKPDIDFYIADFDTSFTRGIPAENQLDLLADNFDQLQGSLLGVVIELASNDLWPHIRTEILEKRADIQKNYEEKTDVVS